jgi:hypothetical protein
MELDAVCDCNTYFKWQMSQTNEANYLDLLDYSKANIEDKEESDLDSILFEF